MTAELPAPLVPGEVDLRDFAFMPLEVSRLLRSRTWLKARRRPEIGFYLVNLWAGAWHEVPAGSLPDDDDVLADLARCTPARWNKLRGEVMAAWVRCADGRLYHPVVCEKAREAWAHKLAQRQRTQAARDARRQRLHVPAATSAAASVAASKGQGQGERKGQGEEEAAAPATADVDQAFALWKQAAAREGWPEVMFLNGPCAASR